MAKEQDEKIMSQLIEYAEERMDKYNVYPYCAFIVKDGVIISKGFNNVIANWGAISNHGEMVAMTKAIKSLNTIDESYLEGYDLYSTCEPCLACFETALFSGISRIIYSVDHNDFPDNFKRHPYTIEDFVSDHPNVIEFIANVRHKEGIALFKKAKKKYGF